MASQSLDSVLEAALASSRPSSAQDMLMIAVHASLLSSGYECIAIGDEKFGDDSATTKPAVSSSSQPGLPEGWNSSQEVYALQYRHKETKQTCLVKGIPLGDQLLLSAVASCSSSEVFTTTLGIADYVQVKDDATFSSKSTFNNLLQLLTVINKDLESKLTNVCGGASMGVAGTAALSRGELPGQRRRGEDPGTEFDDDDDDPLRVGPPRQPRIPPPGAGSDPLRVGPPRRPGRPPIGDPLTDVGPFGYGDRDRFPMGGGGPGLGGIGGRGGGGMIFDPLRQGGRSGFRPQGPYPPSHPPGARFDPVTPFPSHPQPPGRHPRNQGPRFYGREPDPDHLPPPGYDDMFS